MSKKLTISEVKENLLKLNPNIEIMSTEYINAKSKLNCRCLIDNNEWEVNWDNLSHGCGCPVCGGNKKITIEEAKQEFTSRGFIPLFDEYIDANTKLDYMDKDGYKYETRLKHFKSGHECTIVNKKYAIENIKLWIKLNDKQIELLSDNFVNANSKLHWKCLIDRCEWEANWNSLSQEHGCPVCGIKIQIEKRKLSIEEVKQKLNKINPNIELLSTEYVNANSKLHWKCSIDGCEWETTWGSLSYGSGCPVCGRKTAHGDGGYNSTLAERNKEKWKNEKADVYFIECWNNEEHFYKIGITSKKVKQRFAGNQMPYNYKILKLINTNKYDATYIEKQLHEIHDIYSYIPKIEFSGHTECFSHII